MGTTEKSSAEISIYTGLILGTIRYHLGERLEGGGGALHSCVVDLLLSGKDVSLN